MWRGLLFLGTAVAALLGVAIVALQPDSENIITVNSAIRYQTMTGWEGNAVKEEDLKLIEQHVGAIFDIAVNDLGLTRARLEVNGATENPVAGARGVVNDNSDPTVINSAGFQFQDLDYRIEKNILPLRQRTSARGEGVYINLTYVFWAATIHNSDPEEYAEFMLAVFLHMQSKYRFVPNAISLVLEPDLGGSAWTPAAVGKSIVATVKKLQANGFAVPEFVTPDTTSARNTVRFYDQVKSLVPAAIPYIKEISYHRYDNPSTRTVQGIGDRAAAEGKRTAMLEWWSQKNSYQILHEDLKVGRNSSWQQNAFSSDTSGGEYGDPWIQVIGGVVSVSPQSKFTRQYTKYIRPGAQRVEATSNNPSLDPVAFVNSDGKNVVVVKASTGTSFSINNLPAGRYGTFYTTSSQYDVHLPDVTIATGQSVDASITAQGVITIYGKSAVVGPSAPVK